MALTKFSKKKGEDDNLPYSPPADTPPPAEEGEAWLVSYADMMTLLCGFFIMMFSMAKLDAPEFEAMRESVAKEFQVEYKSPTKDNAKFLTQILQEGGVEGEAVIKSDPFGVSITFSSTVFFDTLSSDIKPPAQEILLKLLSGIEARQQATGKKFKIVVEGHTDNRPVLSGLFPSNWELSGSRAARVVRIFLDKGFDPQHLTAIGYADTYPESNPRNPDGTLNDEALTKNRRVVIRVLEPKVDAIPFPSPERAVASTGTAPLATVPAAPSTGPASADAVTPPTAGHAPAGIVAPAVAPIAAPVTPTAPAANAPAGH